MIFLEPSATVLDLLLILGFLSMVAAFPLLVTAAQVIFALSVRADVYICLVMQICECLEIRCVV